MATVHLLCGKTGSGKTTFARRLEQSGAMRFSIDEWREGIASGRIREIFACGTAAVVTPVGALRSTHGDVAAPPSTDLTMRIRQALVDIQYGRAEDTFGWMHQVC